MQWFSDLDQSRLSEEGQGLPRTLPDSRVCPDADMARVPDRSTCEQFQRLVADHGVVCSMSRSGNVWDNAAMESFFSSLKTEDLQDRG
jgi:hypothetical protein